MKKSILITGGTGFIGSNLCRRLLDGNTQIICVDNNYTGSIDNIRNLLDNPDFKFIEHNIVEPIQIEQKIDEIYNLACPASPVAYQEDPLLTVKTCVYGAINVLELARKNNAKILQSSTSEVYGEPLEHPQKESYRGNVNPIGIRSCYDEGKRCAESIFFDYNRIYGTKIKVVRIFNTYGPNMAFDDGRVISNFIYQALKGEPLTIYGDGEQTRSFCYVDDLIDGMCAFMNLNDSTTGPVNLGNDKEFTINELVALLKDKINSELKLTYKKLPDDDPTRRRPNLSYAKEILNYNPKIQLSEGLDKTIEYFKEKLNIKSLP